MKIIKIVFIIAALVACYFVGMRFITKSHSPSATAYHEKDGLEVKVDYCRPYKKGRLIFGGLVPYNQVWRTGANEATLIKFNKNVKIGKAVVKAGTYSLWTIPNPAQWTFILNKEVGQWGTEYDSSQDLVRFEVPIVKLDNALEMLIIDFNDLETGMELLIKWDDTVAKVPIVTA